MLNKMTQIIREQTGNDDMVLSRESVLLNDLGINSFDLINMVCIFEDEFDVEIPDRVIAEFKTVGDVMDYIEKKQN